MLHATAACHLPAPAELEAFPRAPRHRRLLSPMVSRSLRDAAVCMVTYDLHAVSYGTLLVGR